MPDHKLDQMYWMGYCDESIRFAASASDDAEKRIRYLRQHLAECSDCRRANLLKNVDYQVAVILGCVPEWEAGGDIMNRDGYHDILRVVLQAARDQGVLQAEDEAWVQEKAHRYGDPWPGRLG